MPLCKRVVHRIGRCSCCWCCGCGLRVLLRLIHAHCTRPHHPYHRFHQPRPSHTWDSCRLVAVHRNTGGGGLWKVAEKGHRSMGRWRVDACGLFGNELPVATWDSQAGLCATATAVHTCNETELQELQGAQNCYCMILATGSPREGSSNRLAPGHCRNSGRLMQSVTLDL